MTLVCDDLRARLLGELQDRVRTSAPDDGRGVRATPAATSCAALTTAAHDAVFGVLYLMDCHSETEGDGDAVHGWCSSHAGLEDDDLVPDSPDALSDLYEELLGADPLGLEGRDFLT